MTTSIKNPKRKSRRSGFSLKPYLIVIGILLLALTIYIGFRMQVSDKRLIPISVVALIAGVIFEGKRLTEKWLTLLSTVSGAFVFSLLAFLPGKREHDYNLENHIQMWPYFFIFLFAVSLIAAHRDKTTAKLTEGTTLLQSVAVIYWVVDYGFIDTNSYFLKLLMIVGSAFALFSFFHAFSHVVLTRTSRLTLSIWSSIVMMLFAVDNIYMVFQNQQIENTIETSHRLYIGLQYFLLGISAIYVVRNFLMLMGFLPGKATFFNKQYFRELSILKDEHITRYSDRQVSTLHAFYGLLFAGAIFALNYHYQILPRHMAIWTVFAIFPGILIAYGYAVGSQSHR